MGSSGWWGLTGDRAIRGGEGTTGSWPLALPLIRVGGLIWGGAGQGE